MGATDRTQKISDQQTIAHPAPEGLNSELNAQMRSFQSKDKPAASNADILPSGKKVERTEDGFPVGGRIREDVYWQNFHDAEEWSKMQQRPDLNEHEKFAAGTMGLQMRRRQSDPIRDDLIMNGTWDERVNAAQKTLDTWNKMAKVLDGKLSPEEQKLETKVSDELQTELWQEQWRRNKFQPAKPKD